MAGRRWPRWLAAATVCLLAAAGCSSSGSHSDGQSDGQADGGRRGPWSGWSRCAAPLPADLLCGELTVPVDRATPAAHRLRLAVVEGGSVHADRTLLFLTGGPGQPGVGLAPRILPLLAGVADRYRILLVDQRGTGAGALTCPLLQQQVGYADLTVPSRQAVDECAAEVGPDRARYGTTNTVADLDDLRRALGVTRWSLDGVSYGTYVAQRYAAAHPAAVDRLVLDSVVPVDAFDATNAESFPDVAAVLREVCAAQHCPGDPASDLSAVVARDHLGPQLLDLVSVMSVADPSFPGLLSALRSARAGDRTPLDGLLAGWRSGMAGPADQLSQGLHASTLCLDLRFPWGGADAPVPGRARAADRAVARLSPSDLFPFDAQTARANGEMRTCEEWPRTPDPPVGSLSLTGVKALLLHGSRDLSTPLAWARRAHADLPGSRLVVVPGAGHSVQSRGPADVREQVAEFLR